MAIENPTTTSYGIKGLGSGTGLTQSWTITPTTGRGLLINVIFGGGTDIVVNSVTLSTDTLTAVGSILKRGDDTQGCWYYCPNITSASQTLTFNYTQTQNLGALNAAGFEITGHNTESMVGAIQTATDTTSLNLTTTAANSAVFIALQGGNSEPGTASGGSGSWTSTDTDNASRRAWCARNLDIGTAGSKTISWDQGDYAYAIEVKPLAGIVALGGSAITCGIGAQVPSIAVPL